MNKKSYQVTLIIDTDGSNEYRSRIGFNLYELPLGNHSFVLEFFPPEMNRNAVTAVESTISISKTSNTNVHWFSFIIGSKIIPNYIYFDLHERTTSSTTSHLIVYGVNGYESNVDPSI